MSERGHWQGRHNNKGLRRCYLFGAEQIGLYYLYTRRKQRKSAQCMVYNITEIDGRKGVRDSKEGTKHSTIMYVRPATG